MKRRLIKAVPAIVLVIATGCDKLGQPTDEATSSTSETTDTSKIDSTKINDILSQTTSSSSLASAVPSSLALSVFPQSVDATALALTGTVDTTAVDDPNILKTVKEKVEENEQKLLGKADSCLNFDVFKRRNAMSDVRCYEFDSEMNPHKVNTTDQGFGTLDGTDGKGEACLVAFTRSEVNEVVEKVDQAMELTAGLVCQAKKDGKDVELAEGDELDLTASLKAVADGHMPISKAVIKRLSDDGDNRVYHTQIKFDMPDGRTAELNLVNGTQDSGEQQGTLWFGLSSANSATGGAQLLDGAMQQQNPPPSGNQQQNPPPQGNQPQMDPNNSGNKVDAMSIRYHRLVSDDGEIRMQAQAYMAQIVDSIETFDDEGQINFAGVSDTQANSALSAIKYVGFDLYPETNEGSLSYWMNPGGSYNESARGFNFNMEAGDDGLLKGCGVSGATSNLSIRKALKEEKDLAPARYWHPQHNQNIHPDKDARYTAQEGSMITQQCFKQDSEGVYAIDTAETESERGYDVIEVEASDVLPPPPPPANDFQPMIEDK